MKLRLETNLRLWAAILAVGAFAAAAVISTRHLWWPERTVADHVANSAVLRKQIEDSMPGSASTDLRYSSALFLPTPAYRDSALEQPQPTASSPYTYSVHPLSDYYYPRNPNSAARQSNSLPAFTLPELNSIKTDSFSSFQSLPVTTSQDFKLPLQLMVPSPTGGLVSTGDLLPVTPTLGGVQGIPAAPVTGPLSGVKR